MPDHGLHVENLINTAAVIPFQTTVTFIQPTSFTPEAGLNVLYVDGHVGVLSNRQFNTSLNDSTVSPIRPF